MNSPPPPPPPHGNTGTKGSGLPPGNYDIFIIPPHSSGSGFLYLPSLQTHRNSFLAGVGCTLLTLGIWSVVFPVLREWFATIVASGGVAVVVLLVGVGVAGWAWGRTQTETSGPGDGGTGGSTNSHNNFHSAPNANGFPSGGPMPQSPPQPPPQSPPQPPPQPPPQYSSQYEHQPPPQHPRQTPPQPPPQPSPQSPPQPSPQRPPQPSPQRPPQPSPQPPPPPPPQANPPPPPRPPPQPDPQPSRRPPPQAYTPPPHRTPQPPPQAHSPAPPDPTPASEPRTPQKPTWQRATPGPTKTNGSANPAAGKNATGPINSGTAKGGWEKAREETRRKEEERRKAEELKKKREDDEKDKVLRREKEAREREAREQKEKERQEKEGREKEVREKPTLAQTTSHPSARKSENIPGATSPTKRHQQPTAKTATEDDTYSFRPYDKQKRPTPAAASASSIYSESSYAPSYSTSRTTPPPSQRGPYQSKDPDKIVLKAVFSFNNTFTNSPIAKLVSGVGSVTDGLVLRITTEGLFIDDDVRGVPQREWDVKAWTLRLVEVWCPHLHTLGASSGSTPAPRTTGIFGKRGGTKAPSSEESEEFLRSFMRSCKWTGSGRAGSSLGDKSDSRDLSQSGESKGLHVLRANIRDLEGKRYVFVLQEEQGWKVAVGLQRLRRGTQVRALGVSGMSANETKGILENLGWA